MRQPPGPSDQMLNCGSPRPTGSGREEELSPAGPGGGGRLVGTVGVPTHGPGGGEAGGSTRELAGRADKAWGGLPKSGAILISAGLRFLVRGGCREPESCFALEGLGGRGETRARKMLPNCYRFGKGSGAGPRSA